MEGIDSDWENLTNVQKKEVNDRTDLVLNCFKSSTSFCMNFKYYMDHDAQREDNSGLRLVFKNMIDCLFFKILVLDAENTVS